LAKPSINEQKTNPKGFQDAIVLKLVELKSEKGCPRVIFDKLYFMPKMNLLPIKQVGRDGL
jgi:hypothetical protein